MKLSTKTLGVLGIIGAPFLFLEMYTNMQLKSTNTSVGALFDFIYMLGWMCSVVALHRVKATGVKKGSVVILYLQLFFLALANISNIWVMIDPKSEVMLYRILDMFWPVSNVWMAIVGVAVIRQAKLQGWQRYTVLMVGLWFPFVMSLVLIFGREANLFYVASGYSIIAWALMGWAIATYNKPEDQLLVLAV